MKNLLLLLTLLLISSNVYAGWFVEGSFQINNISKQKYNNMKTDDISFNSYPIKIGYSPNDNFEFGILGEYGNFVSNLSANDNLNIDNIYKAGIFTNYKILNFYDFIPFVGIGINYNNWDGNTELVTKNSIRSYCENHSNSTGKYYICKNQISNNFISADLHAGMQYLLTPFFKLVTSVSYEQNINKMKDDNKYQSFTFFLGLRLETISI